MKKASAIPPFEIHIRTPCAAANDILDGFKGNKLGNDVADSETVSTASSRDTPSEGMTWEDEKDAVVAETRKLVRDPKCWPMTFAGRNANLENVSELRGIPAPVRERTLIALLAVVDQMHRM
jgi:hypothetical protein